MSAVWLNCTPEPRAYRKNKSSPNYIPGLYWNIRHWRREEEKQTSTRAGARYVHGSPSRTTKTSVTPYRWERSPKLDAQMRSHCGHATAEVGSGLSLLAGTKLLSDYLTTAVFLSVSSRFHAGGKGRVLPGCRTADNDTCFFSLSLSLSLLFFPDSRCQCPKFSAWVKLENRLWCPCERITKKRERKRHSKKKRKLTWGLRYRICFTAYSLYRVTALLSLALLWLRHSYKPFFLWKLTWELRHDMFYSL